jgi:hypothetical protein
MRAGNLLERLGQVYLYRPAIGTGPIPAHTLVRLRTEGLTNLVADLRGRAGTSEGGRTEPHATASGRTITVRVPISIRRLGGRKLVLALDGTNVTMASARRHIDNAMVKAIARGVPMAGDAGEGHPRDRPGDRRCREDQ